MDDYRPSQNLMRAHLRRNTPNMARLLRALVEKGGSAMFWLTQGEMRSVNILKSRQVLTVIKGRDSGRVSLILTPEARLALGMDQSQAA